MSLTSQLESLLLASPRPLTIRKLGEQTGRTTEDITAALDTLGQKYNVEESGIQVLRHGQTVQFVTSPLNSKLVTEFLKEEQAGELTRPALETLTIVAYRGPISKIQLDTIRGVNCSLILRHLMIKGLIEGKTAKDKLQTTYQVTADFVRFLGLTDITQLPDYEQLHHDERLELLLNPTAVTTTEEAPSPSTPA
ncbi:MAG: SMC-Scp complex subunit ScpB [Candidatus Kerfeldbacteria bacterium]|nr:SMC-Scp complex subunit ScpB [Candidatus Kerfeldbacteria bacterium]